MYFGDVEPFLMLHTDIGPQTRPKLLGYFDDPQKIRHVKLELAAVVDYGVPFVKATCNLEGDGLKVLSCYETVQEIVAFIVPNLMATIRDASPNNVVHQQLKICAKQCIQPGLDYFHKQLQTNLKGSLASFKAAHLFNPCKVQQMKPHRASVDQLISFPFVISEMIVNLKSELPKYFSKYEHLDEATVVEKPRITFATLGNNC